MSHHKNNTDRMNQLVGEMFLPGWRSCDSHTSNDHRCLTKKQHRQDGPVGWVDFATGVEVPMTVDPRNV